MFSRVKAILAFIATLVMMTVTLGSYARYQKRRADKAETEAEERQRIINQAQAIEQKMHGARVENYETRQRSNKHKNNRTFFDKL